MPIPADDVQVQTNAPQSDPAFALLAKVFANPVVRALSPQTRLVHLACVTHAWQPEDHDDERCGCLRRVGVGPYSPEDIAAIAAMTVLTIRREAQKLESVGLVDRVVVDGEWYLRVIDCRHRECAPGPASIEAPPPPTPSEISTMTAVAYDAGEYHLPVDDPRVEMLVKQGVSRAIACRYAGRYSSLDLLLEVLRVQANPRVRDAAAVLTANLKTGRIERGWLTRIATESRSGLLPSYGSRGLHRKRPRWSDPDEPVWPWDD